MEIDKAKRTVPKDAGGDEPPDSHSEIEMTETQMKDDGEKTRKSDVVDVNYNNKRVASET